MFHWLSDGFEDIPEALVLIQAGDIQPFVFRLSNVTVSSAAFHLASGWNADVLSVLSNNTMEDFGV